MSYEKYIEFLYFTIILGGKVLDLTTFRRQFLREARNAHFFHKLFRFHRKIIDFSRQHAFIFQLQ